METTTDAVLRVETALARAEAKRDGEALDEAVGAPMDHRTMQHSYPNLAAMMGGAFHQDRRFDHDSAEDVLSEEVFSQPVGDRRAFLDEVEHFLQEFTTEDGARAALRSTGTGFRARYDAGEDTLPWLRSLRSRLVVGFAGEEGADGTTPSAASSAVGGRA
jgi:hypothetical protein